MLRRKIKDLGGIPTASMSDVAFLLLVFFLSTTKFDIKKGLGIVLPAVSDGTQKKVKLKDDNLTKIWIDKDGIITLISGGEERVVPMNELQKIIHKIVNDNPDLVISLKTDRKSKYQYMVKVLDKLQASGAEKISLSKN